ncbi:MAG: NUDIX domain-containing protein [Bacteroidales bacterium]|jgi:ADP-ribose pyrophosphatase YjhB (NUDIX family)|nr:NUDIX domain-containing protein [Bacteroidales bacterium]
MNPSFLSGRLHYCPWCGADAFRAGKENCLQCEECGQKLFINASAAVAGVIVNDRSEILLTRRRKEPARGMFDLPGGFVNIDETAEDAIRREIKEELNLQTGRLRYFGSSANRYLYGGVLYHTLDLGFECSVTDFSPLKADDDVESCVFLPYGEIDFRQIGFPSIRRLIKQYHSIRVNGE